MKRELSKSTQTKLAFAILTAFAVASMAFSAHFAVKEEWLWAIFGGLNGLCSAIMMAAFYKIAR